MAKFTSVIDYMHDSITIKDYLRKELQISSRQIKKLKAYDDGILVNGKHAIVIDILKTGDILEINSHDDVKQYELSSIIPDIIFEDDNYIAVNKPYNMTVYKCGDVEENLLSSVCGYYFSKGLNLVFRPFYRLDKDTTGIVLIAKNSIVSSTSIIKKSYYAVCEGKTPDFGVIDSPIHLSENSRIKRETGKYGEKAITEFSTICYDGIHSLVRFNLLTGRTHQIRVHMSSIGFPLAGDDLYGGSMNYINRQALHCKELTIENALTNTKLHIDSVFPDDFYSSFNSLLRKGGY